MTEIIRSEIKKGYKRRKIRAVSVNIIIFLLTAGLCTIMLLYGKNNYDLNTVIRVISGEEIQGASFTIGILRLPRMLCGLLAGIAFGIAGNSFQTMLRNPLASPDIIGISSGSSVAAVFCILVLKMSGSYVSIAAVTSGILVAVLIYILSKGSGFSGSRLILIGIGIQAMINALISYLLAKASQHDVPTALRWLSGSLSGMTMEEVPTLFIVVVIVWDLVSRGRYPYQSFLKSMNKVDFDAIGEALEMMGIAELSNRCVDELSGGQRQRVWIAMALAQQTDILLFDEPTTYLDIAYQVEILDLLTELNRKKGTTIVMILHDINLSARYADYIFALRAGKLIPFIVPKGRNLTID